MEYYVINLDYIRTPLELEDELNQRAESGWKVKTFCQTGDGINANPEGKMLILERETK